MTIDEVTTMSELIARVQDAWQPWITAIRGIDAVDFGKADAAGWTIRDHITHVTAWEASLTAALTGQPRYLALGIPEEALRNPEIDALNDMIRAAHAHVSGRLAVVRARVGHDVFMDVLGALPDDMVSRPMSDFVPMQSAAGTKTSAALWIWGDSGAHYPLHLEYIRRILGEAKGGLPDADER